MVAAGPWRRGAMRGSAPGQRHSKLSSLEPTLRGGEEFDHDVAVRIAQEPFKGRVNKIEFAVGLLR